MGGRFAGGYLYYTRGELDLKATVVAVAAAAAAAAVVEATATAGVHRPREQSSRSRGHVLNPFAPLASSATTMHPLAALRRFRGRRRSIFSGRPTITCVELQFGRLTAAAAAQQDRQNDLVVRFVRSIRRRSRRRVAYTDTLHSRRSFLPVRRRREHVLDVFLFSFLLSHTFISILSRNYTYTYIVIKRRKTSGEKKKE